MAGNMNNKKQRKAFNMKEENKTKSNIILFACAMAINASGWEFVKENDKWDCGIEKKVVAGEEFESLWIGYPPGAVRAWSYGLLRQKIKLPQASKGKRVLSFNIFDNQNESYDPEKYTLGQTFSQVFIDDKEVWAEDVIYGPVRNNWQSVEIDITPLVKDKEEVVLGLKIYVNRGWTGCGQCKVWWSRLMLQTSENKADIPLAPIISKKLAERKVYPNTKLISEDKFSVSKLKAGVAKVSLVPDKKAELWGYGVYLGRIFNSVHDPIYAKAIVLGDEQNKIVIIANDLGGVNKEVVEKTRGLIEKELGIKSQNILICASHTHSAPAVAYLGGWGEVDKDYLDFLAQRWLEVTREAVNKMKGAKIGFSQTTFSEGIWNRDHHGGKPIDETVGIIRIDDLENRPQAILYNFASHPVFLGSKNLEISADYPGCVAQFVEKRFKGSFCLFLQGACGDINPKFEKERIPLEEQFILAKSFGERLGSSIVTAAGDIKTSPQVKMSSRFVEVCLPVQVPSLSIVQREVSEYKEKAKPLDPKSYIGRMNQAYLDSTLKWCQMIEAGRVSDEIKTSINIFSINDTVFISVPAELWVSFGLKIKERSPFARTYILGYANDYLNYIPEEEFYWGTAFWRMSWRNPRLAGLFPFREDIGNVFVDTVIQEIKSLKESSL